MMRMLWYRSSTQKILPRGLSLRIGNAQPKRSFISTPRNSSSSTPKDYASKKFSKFYLPACRNIIKMLMQAVYPERLLVYHAGTGRTVFIGCLKVTTIFVFSFFGLVVAPTHFYSEVEEPLWVPAAGMLALFICRFSIFDLNSYLKVCSCLAATSKPCLLQFF